MDYYATKRCRPRGRTQQWLAHGSRGGFISAVSRAGGQEAAARATPDFNESLDIGRKTRLAGLPGKIHINDPLSLNESPNYQISDQSESHQIS
jgi:hypothetical protein